MFSSTTEVSSRRRSRYGTSCSGSPVQLDQVDRPRTRAAAQFSIGSGSSSARPSSAIASGQVARRRCPRRLNGMLRPDAVDAAPPSASITGSSTSAASSQVTCAGSPAASVIVTRPLAEARHQAISLPRGLEHPLDALHHRLGGRSGFCGQVPCSTLIVALSTPAAAHPFSIGSGVTRAVEVQLALLHLGADLGADLLPRSRSHSPTKVMAVPSLPARAVRPMRWT